MPNTITVYFKQEPDGLPEELRLPTKFNDATVQYQQGVVIIIDRYNNTTAYPLDSVSKVVDSDPSRQPRRY